MQRIPSILLIACILYVCGGLGLSALQVAKAHADRIAVTICEASKDCR